MDKMRLLRPGSFPKLRLSFFCGEPLLESTIVAWGKAAAASRIINLYGPSETTIAISAYEWKPGQNKAMNGIVSIGKVFPGHEYALLNDDDRKTEEGDRGFLHIKGSQVIEGYLDSRDNENSFKKLGNGDQEHWYNTGDLVTGDANGDLFFLGRADHEVKISGYRVNLLAIDDTIRKLSGISQVATIAVTEEKSGSTALFAFLEGSPGQFNEQDLLSFCRNELPWYMVPQRFVAIDRLPLNENGKIDRKRLNDYL
jgi:acyl-CoA synthetase (AMP-forming)/AMP-acid ligase II